MIKSWWLVERRGEVRCQKYLQFDDDDPLVLISSVALPPVPPIFDMFRRSPARARYLRQMDWTRLVSFIHN